MAKIQEDCFYYIESGVAFEEARIRAMCKECWQEKKRKGAMYWPGERVGFGDYDLYCTIDGCGKPIHIRDDI